MKKNQTKLLSGSGRRKKILLTMKLTVTILLAGMLQVTAASYSQSTKLSMEVDGKQVAEVLREIESISDFRFFYQREQVDVERIVNIRVKDQTIDKILNKLFPGDVIDHKVYADKLILIAPREVLAQATEKSLQQTDVTGTVTDENGDPIIGATVSVKGTSVGTITDGDGNYRINVPPDGNVLIISFIGMKSVEETIGDRTTIDVILETDILGLEEVVVTGYGTQMKESLTGSISVVKADELEKSTESNILRRMQGRVSGVHILNAHTPGGEATVRIRGLGTINNNDPLFIIDNVPARSGLSDLNPNDIESISVLKDAASTGIYGARGANGVIIITTKRGTMGQGIKNQVSFTASGGLNVAANKYDLLNTQEYGELLWLEAANEGIDPSNTLYGNGVNPDIPDYILPVRASEGDPSVDPALYNYSEPYYLIMPANKTGTDWFDVATQRGKVSEYNLAISSSAESSSYAVSAGYMREEGIFKHSSYERYSIRANADNKFGDWLKIGETIGLTHSKGLGDQRIENGERSIVTNINGIQPIVPVYDIMGNFAGTRSGSVGIFGNPLAVLYRNRNDVRNRLRVIGNVFAQADITSYLSFKSLVGVDYLVGHSRAFSLVDPEKFSPRINDELYESTSRGLQWNWTNTMNFNKSFADLHNLNVLLGTEAVSNDAKSFSARGTNFFLTTVDYMVLNAAEANRTGYGSGSQWKTFSYFGRLNYDYSGKYLAQVTLRHDGSSRFGRNNRWGTFPAASVGWRISGEDFMASTQNWLNYLKLRVGWGQSGNDLIGNYNGYTTFASGQSTSYYGLDGDNTSTTAGFESSAFGNPDAKWETITTTNVGIDANILNDAVAMNIDIWQRRTTDMLFPKAIPAVVGQAAVPSINVGDMKNTGFDIALSHAGRFSGGDFRYNVSLNISHYKNEILKLSENADEALYGGSTESTDYNSIAEVGTAFPEFWGYIVDGIFQTPQEAEAHPPAFGASGTYNEVGHFKFRDVNQDGVIDSEDRTYLGSPHPDFTAGLNFDLGYRGFDLTAFFYTSYGNELVNDVKRWIDYPSYDGNRSHDRLYNSWGSPYLDNNEDATLAKADRDMGSIVPSSHFVEDASYLRLKNLQLGYSLPQSLVSKLNIGSLRVYIQGSNIFTLTKYSGIDPEVRARFAGINMGVDMGAWPTYRQFMIGVSISM